MSFGGSDPGAAAAALAATIPPISGPLAIGGLSFSPTGQLISAPQFPSNPYLPGGGQQPFGYPTNAAPTVQNMAASAPAAASNVPPGLQQFAQLASQGAAEAMNGGGMQGATGSGAGNFGAPGGFNGAAGLPAGGQMAQMGALTGASPYGGSVDFGSVGKGAALGALIGALSGNPMGIAMGGLMGAGKAAIQGMMSNAPTGYMGDGSLGNGVVGRGDLMAAGAGMSPGQVNGLMSQGTDYSAADYGGNGANGGGGGVDSSIGGLY